MSISKEACILLMLKLEKLSQKVSIYSAVSSRAAFRSRDCLSILSMAKFLKSYIPWLVACCEVDLGPKGPSINYVVSVGGRVGLNRTGHMSV